MNTADMQERLAFLSHSVKLLKSAAKEQHRDLTIAEQETIQRAKKESKEIRHSLEVSRGVRTVASPMVDLSKRYDQAFDTYMRTAAVSPELRATYGSAQGEAGFQSSGSSGGYLVPQGFWEQLTIALKAYNGFAEYYRQVETPTGNPMDWPTTDPTGIVGGIIGEGVIDGFTEYTFGQGVLQAW